MPPATRETPTTEPGAGAGGRAEGNPPTPSLSPGRTNFGGINGSSSSSSSSDDSCISSDISNNNESGDFPALVGRPAQDLEGFGELPALRHGRTRSQSRSSTMSAPYDLLLAYTMRTVEAKRTEEEEAAEIERAHNPLLKEHLEKEPEWLEVLERHGALLEQREEEQDSDCSLAIAVEQQPELCIPSQVGRKPSEGESPPHIVAGVDPSIYRKGC